MIHLYVKPKKNNGTAELAIVSFEVVTVTNVILPYCNVIQICDLLSNAKSKIKVDERRFVDALCNILEIRKVEKENAETVLLEKLTEFTKAFPQFGFFKEEPKKESPNDTSKTKANL